MQDLIRDIDPATLPMLAFFGKDDPESSPKGGVYRIYPGVSPYPFGAPVLVAVRADHEAGVRAAIASGRKALFIGQIPVHETANAAEAALMSDFEAE